MQLWDADIGKPVGSPLVGHDDWVYAVAYSPNGHTIVSGSRDDTLIVWDARTRQRIRTLKGHTDDVWSVAFSSDGKRIASGSKDKAIIIWDSRTGEQLHQLRGHNNTVWAVQFSPNNNNLLASSGYDRTVRLWDIQQGRQIGSPLEGHAGSVWSIDFTSDGTQVLSVGSDLTLRRWPTNLNAWPQMACDRIKYHPILTDPKTILANEELFADQESLFIAKEAKEACNNRPWQQDTDDSVIHRK